MSLLPRQRTLARETVVRRPREAVWRFLAVLDNHWLISGDRLVSRHEQVDDRTARVLFGPPGFRRWATSRIDRAEAPELIEGSAETGRSDGTIRWLLDDRGDGTTLVRFSMTVRPRPLDDRILVALSSWWLERHYARSLERLRRRLEGQDLGEAGTSRWDTGSEAMDKEEVG